MEAMEKLLDFVKEIRNKLSDRYISIFFDELKVEDIYEKDIENYLVDLERLIKILNYTDEEWIENKCIFDQFDSLSEYFAFCDLRVKEKLEIVLKIIELNIRSNVFDHVSKSVDFYDLLNHDFKLIEKSELDDLLKNGRINSFINEPHIELTPLDILKRTELLLALESLSIDFTNIANLNKKIYYILVENKDKLTVNGMNAALSAMESLGLNKDLVSSFGVILEKQIRRNSRKNTVSVTTPIKEEKVEEKKYLNDKEYTAIKKEIYKYYNMYKCSLVQELSFDEALYVASLMIKLGEDVSDVENFFRKYYRTLNEEKRVCVTEYLTDYDKLRYYYNEDELAYLEDCFKEIFICEDSEYVFWKEQLHNNLLELKSRIKDKYSYEYSLAKTFKKVV